MPQDSADSHVPVVRWHANLLLIAAVLTGLLVTLGGTVCVTESAGGCPDWPGCYGRIVPPPQINAIIEYLHRFTAALTSPLIIAAAVAGWRRTRSLRWVSRPPLVTIPFLIAVIVFGAIAVLRGLPPIPATIDLGSALAVLALMVTAAVAASVQRAGPAVPDHFHMSDSLTRLSLAATAGVYLVYISGILVAGKGSLTRCVGWPMWRILPDDAAGWPQYARLALAVVTAGLVAAAIVRALGRKGVAPGARRLAGFAGVAFLLELATGLLLLAGTTPWLLILYVALATTTYALLAALAATSGLAGMQTSRYAPPARTRVRSALGAPRTR